MEGLFGGAGNKRWREETEGKEGKRYCEERGREGGEESVCCHEGNKRTGRKANKRLGVRVRLTTLFADICGQ